MVWLFPIFKATVGRWEYQRFQRFVRALVQRRIEVSDGSLFRPSCTVESTNVDALLLSLTQTPQNEPQVPDVFHWILSDFQENPKPTWQDKENLVGDASLIVVAGR